MVLWEYTIISLLSRSNLVSIIVRYQLGVILEYIFLPVKFYVALK